MSRSDGEVEQLLSDDTNEDILPLNESIKVRLDGKEPRKTLEYWTFMSIGLSYLWPWNCFLAAGAYFNYRFGDHELLKQNFNSSMMTVSTITSTFGSLILAERQRGYSKRIAVGEGLIATVFVLLALSCPIAMGENVYFIFLLFCIFGSTVGTIFSQNGSFAVVSNFGPEYTQAIMVGQAVSGILPPVLSLVSALVVGSSNPGSSGAAASNFLVCTGIAIGTIAMYYTIDKRHSISQEMDMEVDKSDSKPHYPLVVLLKQLHAPVFAVFMTFAATLVYPVFANNVQSVNGWRQEVFIPLTYLIWNMGDLIGRIICAEPKFVVRKPNTLITYGLLRLLFWPAFFLANIRGTAIVESDVLYLLLQLAFGITNGHLGTSGMMVATTDYATDDQKAAAGGFMTLALSTGLAAGSLISFIFVALV